jgi:hypothetical protein
MSRRSLHPEQSGRSLLAWGAAPGGGDDEQGLFYISPDRKFSVGWTVKTDSYYSSGWHARTALIQDSPFRATPDTRNQLRWYQLMGSARFTWMINTAKRCELDLLLPLSSTGPRTVQR